MTCSPPTVDTQKARPDKVEAPTKRGQAEEIKVNYVIEAPSFNLGFDVEDTDKEIEERGRNEMDCDKGNEEDAAGKDKDNTAWDIDWDNEELKAACALADEKALAQQTLKGEDKQDTSTPVKLGTPHIDLATSHINLSTPHIDLSSGSTPIQRGHERRPVKLPPCKRSHFVNYGSKLAWVCSRETNEVYDAVLLHGQSNKRDKGPDNR